MATTALCPCGTEKQYTECCEPAILGRAPAPTAERLMRSRYTAYVKHAIPYLRESLWPAARGDFDEASAAKWAKEAKWLGLEVLHTEAGGEGDTEGQVEFIAKYEHAGEAYGHHELADFKKQDGKWYFVDGRPPGMRPRVREDAKIGRNDPCTCGSGKKYKKCCG